MSLLRYNGSNNAKKKRNDRIKLELLLWIIKIDIYSIQLDESIYIINYVQLMNIVKYAEGLLFCKTLSETKKKKNWHIEIIKIIETKFNGQNVWLYVQTEL